jgi:hypothetical protein
MAGKRIPIVRATEIAEKYGYFLVVRLVASNGSQLMG